MAWIAVITAAYNVWTGIGAGVNGMCPAYRATLLQF